ncbi:Phospho-2-dehydro-3-deoxyheptonate aldolase, Tyr-sensitive [Desulfonema limicola]|uniref:Phospho-2-dehydro-3-deoxyheptonate aldolase n=1 Tax=Desulfonema limicola TaxID=45656 RepID=A0A975BA40_9BACT|nr:3-deoxy-7-phosphoheptulonate synthase [Desulfonema limicola]QTA81489.1 Phospho-2-dehydro-3-deoxyheptonate aldolase, Tyr-sensitive [Desulfonema limicola]
MQQTYDVRVEKFIPLIPPVELKHELPVSEKAAQTVLASREIIENILEKKDKRLMVVTGPCSIHDEKAAIEYAEKLKKLSAEVDETMYLVMRVYFEKPRTTIGWKGLINDPYMDGSCDIVAGLRKARKLLIDITEIGVPTGTEMLDPITPQYIAGLISWSAIGARTTESQTHREMASGLSMPVGFKNCTDGGLSTAINAMIAAISPQSFLGIDQEGRSCIVKTKGNPGAHIVLRGGQRPNYDSVSVADAVSQLKAKNLPQSIVVDCSHANSRKKFQGQAVAWQDVINQILDGNDSIIGMMLESSLFEGSQKNTGDLSTMKYGVSITDECISWETTQQLILSAHEHLLNNKNSSKGQNRYSIA